MAIELTEYNQPALVLRSGIGDDIYVDAGEYFQIRHGLLADPTIPLQEQCPAGKAWSVRVIVEIEETDA